MAHFAKLDENNNVIQIDTIDNANMLDENEQEQEAIGIAYLKSLFGDQKWVQTSINTSGGIHKEGRIPLRKNYAVIDGYYDDAKDAFINKKPFNSWILDEQTFQWVAPVERPNLRNQVWDEETLSWVTKEL